MLRHWGKIELIKGTWLSYAREKGCHSVGWWHAPVIPAAWEVEIGGSRIEAKVSPGQKA
jgi:hypothetical protein